MTRKKYRKMMQIICTILVIVNVFLLVRLFILKDNVSVKQSEIINLKLESSEMDDEIIDAQNQLEIKKNDNQSLIEEYENWQRQNQKLEDILR